MAASTTTPTTFWDPEDWEIVNDDGFVYKRKKRRIDPFSFPRAPDPVPDPALQLKQRRKKKLATLRNLKEKYQTEICLWDNLSNTLKTMEDSAKSKLEQVKEKDDEEGEGWKVLEMGGKGSASVVSVEKCSGSLVDELLLQVEAQEAIIHSFEQLCDIAESLCNAQEEKVKEHYFNLPIWDSPRELMTFPFLSLLHSFEKTQKLAHFFRSVDALFMSSKERPTLGGTRIKTRKRNIAAPLDPAAFSDAVVQIYLDNAGDLELIAKSIESSELDFSRYGDTFFEVVFTGGRTQPGTTKPDEGERHTYSVIHCEPTREDILPSVFFIQKILRRRPFLIKYLENVMRRFLQSLELFEDNERKKLAIFTALAFSQKLSGLPPETVFQPLLKDNLVAKGLVLTFLTEFFKEFLVENTLDDLIALLKRGKVEDKLLDFFPSSKRSPEAFSEHFTKEGLVPLVQYNEKKLFELKLAEMKSALTTQISEEADVEEVIETVKHHVKESKLPDIEIVRLLWDVIMDAVQWSGKNQQQNANTALRQVKTWAKLLNSYCTSGKLELELIYKVQIQCYEDAKLMKLFPEIVRSLYDQDVLAEDTILHWFRKGTNPKGRQTFVKSLEPFVKWLEEAEEEE